MNLRNFSINFENFESFSKLLYRFLIIKIKKYDQKLILKENYFLIFISTIRDIKNVLRKLIYCNDLNSFL